MYIAPKIVASLDADVVLTDAAGSDGSVCSPLTCS